MEGNLVIVESPAKAKTIQKFLGKDFTVKSSYGHIRDLKEKNLSIDVESGFKPEYIVPDSKKKVVADLKSAASKAGTVWLASDEDREGEAIAWHLSDVLGLDPSRTHRIAFHEITRDAIRNAIENPRKIDMDMVNAQQARRVIDRLVGFELSPILWRKVKRGLSAGRVQSVALRLIVDKEREINAFVPEPFYRVEAVFDIDGNKVKGLLDRKFSSAEEAQAFLQDSIGAVYTAESVERKEGTKSPAAPFTTSTLQQEAGRKLHFPVALTMRLAQGLYERGLITYMRTDSTNLSSLALGTAKTFILDNFGEEYLHTRQYRTNVKGAQEAHEAIRPTYIANTEIEGTAQEKKLYSLIWMRTVASQMANADIMNTSIKLNSDKREEKFTIQAREILFDGFLKLYSEGSDDQENPDGQDAVPTVNPGEKIECTLINAECKYTQAPSRYSEPTLVKKLEELEIGRPSTYATIISTLTTGRGYVVKGDKDGRKQTVTNFSLKNGKISSSTKEETIGAEKGKLLPTDIGVIVSDYLTGTFPNIMDYDFTARIEKDFDKIAEGSLVWNDLVGQFYPEFHEKVDNAVNDGQYSHVEKDLGTDPSDGRRIVAKFGQFGPYVQKGEGDDKVFASLEKGQIIESLTLEDALKLFALPRTVGQYEGMDVIATKGRFGPFLRHGDRNVSLPKGANPLTITLDECISLIEDNRKRPAENVVIKEFRDSGISVINGRFGPYLKRDGSNFKLDKGVDIEALTEEECLKVISNQAPTVRKFRKYKKSK